jgi:phosphonate transport system permease protein
MEIKRNILGRPQFGKRGTAERIITLLVIIFVIITVYTVFFRVEYKWEDFQGDVAIKMATNFLRFDKLAPEKIWEMLSSLLNTLALAFITTVMGFIFGFIFGLLAARNLSTGPMTTAIRAVATFIRAVPTIIWVLIFVSGYGLTSTTAVVGMFFHTFAFFVKSFAEAFEEIDKGTIEALRATGSTWFQIVFGAVIPSSLTKMISWLALRSEINFGVAVVIGPAAGVPGTIGTIINNASRAGDYHIQGFGVILIFLTAFIMETVINRFRQKSIIASN